MVLLIILISVLFWCWLNLNFEEKSFYWSQFRQFQKNFFSLRHKVADKLIEGMERNKDGTDKEIIITDKEIDRTDMKIER